MVTTTDTTEIVTQPKTAEENQPSFKRWLKHVLYMPATKRYFSKHDQAAIAQAVTEAEHGHVGEIQVVIEGHLPVNQAYFQNTHMRARQLFAELGVWDTEYNSGVLLYINLCERKVEIIIDRGIKMATEQIIWDEICQNMVAQLAQQQFQQAVINGMMGIGQVLNQFYARSINDKSNELGNDPVILG
ncbi:TPM domain-containing protein [Acinetobacter sp.]|uniref:TPM domain-containing protein n=1 Tax=Acinetobacter sp. TaxID=472 RepID=UPI002647243C|nr:TPM domain-containing protein [Acinetobacter sp.]MDN5512616.1 TPM domain-containing protein [Acinetobacter sp.]MDN5525796.1 TPM domain-containing protein [Acinetobacter sp.]